VVATDRRDAVTAPPQGVASQVDVSRAVREALSEYTTARTHAARRYGPEFVQLWAIASQKMLGGKFVRPILLVEVASAFGRERGQVRHELDDGRADRAVIDAAAAVELLHFAFVLHDDVIDGDLVRRGQPNLVGAVVAKHPSQRRAGSRFLPNSDRRSTAMHWGTSSAILMGDLVLSGVYQSFAMLDVPATTRRRLFDLLGHTIDETVAGEFADVGLGDGCLEPDLATILEMSANKTATYTFEFPLRIAAILSGADRGVEESLAQAGRHLGLAFQLQDDLLSVFGDPHRHGKDANSDLREGKQTALIAYARMTNAWTEVEPLLGRADLTAAEADNVRSLLDACGARAFVEGLIEDSLASFRDVCNDAGAGIPAEVRSVLVETATQLASRQS